MTERCPSDDADASPSSHAARPAIRIGAVSYLNSKPLIEGLRNATDDHQLILDYPSRLADSLAHGDMDVALIPSIEVIRSHGDYEIVSNACVAAHGPVRSVKVYFRVPPGRVKTLALDEGSRTSATLARVLLAHKYGVVPKTVPLPLGQRAADTKVDAVLLIGDRAIYPVREAYVDEWDLGRLWKEWTGLPFVFATWAGRSEAIEEKVARKLAEARDLGLANIDRIAREQAESLKLDHGLVLEYLTKNLHFTLGPAEKSALKLFAELAAEIGLAPKGNNLVFHERVNYGTADNPAHATRAESRSAASDREQHCVSSR